MTCVLLLSWVPAAPTRSLAVGPVTSAGSGWLVDHSQSRPPNVKNSVLTVSGDARVYLVQDWAKQSLGEHQYARFDLSKSPLEFTLDLSNVPCGCLACVCARLCESNAQALYRVCIVLTACLRRALQILSRWKTPPT